MIGLVIREGIDNKQWNEKTTPKKHTSKNDNKGSFDLALYCFFSINFKSNINTMKIKLTLLSLLFTFQLIGQTEPIFVTHEPHCEEIDLSKEVNEMSCLNRARKKSTANQ